MWSSRTGVWLGAATFALGLSLAGPQVAVAVADNNGTESDSPPVSRGQDAKTVMSAAHSHQTPSLQRPSGRSVRPAATATTRAVRSAAIQGRAPAARLIAPASAIAEAVPNATRTAASPVSGGRTSTGAVVGASGIAREPAAIGALAVNAAMAPLKPSAIAGGQSGPFLGLFGDGLSAPADCEAGTAACNGGNGGLIFGNGGNGANGGNGGNGGFLLGSGGNGGAGVNGGNGGRAWLFGSGGDGGNGTNGGNGGRGGLILGNGGSGGDGGEGGVGGAAGRGGVLAGNPGMPGHSGQDIQQVSRYSIVTIKVDAGPQGLTVGPGGNGLYVLSSAGQSVSVINTDPYSPGYNMVTQTYSVAEGIDGDTDPSASWRGRGLSWSRA